MTNFSCLNADDFKKWMKYHPEFDSSIKQKSLVGLTVETRVAQKRLAKHMIVEKGNPHKVIKEFAEDGGVIKEVNDDEYLVEVRSGLFQINKKYVVI
jgi:antitoxin component YwqK of YwqJK toxin-antitoxin module